jgi:hypothetical protein
VGVEISLWRREQLKRVRESSFGAPAEIKNG